MRTAIVTIAAALASFGLAYLICIHAGVNSSPAILAAALAVGVTRRTEPLTARSFALRIVALPLIALCAGIVGLTFRTHFAIGAAAFCVCLALSVWLRRFGAPARRISRTIALPFVMILAVPVAVNAGSRVADAALVMLAGVLALLCAATATWFATRAGWMRLDEAPRPERVQRKGSIDAGTRMALQMLVALGLAFIVGSLVLPQHWAWVVLTAFIVCSGAAGRGDAIYKGMLRLGGAIGGTFAAALVAPLALVDSHLTTVAIFAALFVGTWLRERNYAYWAACATMIFALLQGSHGSPSPALFGLRVLAIAAGALCAIAATWFVLPIRTERVIRRRIADVLASTDVQTLRWSLAELRRAAPPVALHRALLARGAGSVHPAAWIDATLEIAADGEGLVAASAHPSPEVRRALGGARKAMAQPSEHVATALVHLRDALAGARGRPVPMAQEPMTRTMTIHVSVAMTIDGYIDDRSARRLVLSSDEDLADMRAARARCDAVLVGAGTVRSDDPSLRAPEGMIAPIRVTLTRSGNLDAQARIFDGGARAIVLTTAEAAAPLRSALADRAEVHALPVLTPESIVASLQSLGIGSLFIEGGTQVLTAFLASGLFDRLRLAVTPFFAGERGGARVVDPARFADDAGHRLLLRHARMLGDTAVLDYERRPA